MLGTATPNPVPDPPRKGQGARTRTLALLGFMGSGKSTVGRLVAERLQAPHRDLDAMIEESAGMTIGQLFADRGEAAFRALEAELLPVALEPGAVASLGGGTPLSELNWSLIRRRAFTVWLDAPLPVLLDRLGAGQHRARPLFDGRSPDQLEGLLQARLGRYRAANRRVDARRSAEEVAMEVCRLWAE
jgi:shikimate kinase